MKGWKLGVALGLAALTVACGSEESTSVTVAVGPAAVTVVPGGTQQFSATVIGASDTSVTWAVNDVTGGNATLGTISSTGLYTAPATPPNPSTVTIRATSVARTTASATAMVTIDSGISVQVAPSPASVGTGESFPFVATVNGTSNTAVNWLVNDVAGGNATVGTISSTGLYTAPSTPPSPATVTVRATSQADSSRSGTASVTVVAAADPTLTAISPGTAAEGAFFLDLHLTGTNLLSTTTVRVNATAVPSTFISPTLLRARIPAALLAAAGPRTVDVLRQNGAGSGALSLAVEAVRPALVATSPDSAPQGGGAPSVLFDGGYFSPSVVAEFDGQVRGAMPSSSRQLNVTLLPADVTAEAGLFAVSVRNPSASPAAASANFAVQPPSGTASVVATLAVGTQPASVAVNTATGVAVVANRGSNSVTLIDLATRTVFATLPVGTAPTGVAVDNLRNLALVANNGSDNLSVIDLGSATVTSTIASPTPSGATAPLKPVSVAVNPLTGLALVANRATNTATVVNLATSPPSIAGTVSGLGTGNNPQVGVEPHLNWGIVTPGSAGAITIVDLGRRAVVATVTAGVNVQGISVNPETQRALLTDPSVANGLIFSVLDQGVTPVALETGHVAAAVNPFTDIGVSVNSTTNLVSIIDLRTPVRLATLPVGTSPRAVAIDPGSNVAVVANEGSDTISILALGAIRPLHIAQISPISAFSSASGASLTIVGHGFESSSVVRLDGTPVATTFTSSRRLDATIPAALLATARRYAVDVENAGTVRSNIEAFAVIQAIPVGTAPRAVAIDAQRNLAVVANSGSNNVSVVDLSAGTVTQTITVGTNPQGVAVLPRAGRAVVTNRGSSTASLVDLVAGSVTASVNVGTEPLGVAVNPDTGVAVVVNAGSNNLHFFPADSGQNVASLGVDQRPVAVAFDYTRNLAAVAHASSNNVALVSFAASSPVLSSRVTGLQLPTGVAYDPASDRFLVVSSLTNNLAIIAPDTLQLALARVGINPTSLAYNFNASTLVTANTASNTLSVMDFLDRRIRAVVPVAVSAPLALDIHPRTNLAVLADEANNRVLLVPLPR